MLTVIRDANEDGEEPRLPVSGTAHPDTEAHARLLKDLLADGLVRADMQPTNGAGTFAAIRGLRITPRGEALLDDSTRDDGQPVTVEQMRAIEALLTAGRQIRDALDSEASARSLLTYLDLVEPALREPEPDPPLLRRLLQLTKRAATSVTGNVVANLIAGKLMPHLDRALHLLS